VPKLKNFLFLTALALLTPYSFAGYYQGDGSVVSTVEINDSTADGPDLSDADRYGQSVANIGDLDGDGVTDIAVGAPFDDEGGSSRGAVHIHFMNTDGSIDSTVEINDSTANGPDLTDVDKYGVSVVSIGDLNGDGVNDLAVGAERDDEGGTDRGTVHIHFMNTDGSIDSTVEINDSTSNGPELSDSDYYGQTIDNIGDLDGDGVNDLVVGAYEDDAGGDARGAVHIHFMNTDGSIDSTVEINDSTANGPDLSNGDRYGKSVANIGDLNGDGVTDIAVGAYIDGGGGIGRGAVHIHFMNTDGSIDSTVEINDSTTNGPDLIDWDQYGYSLTDLDDLDGDGVRDIAVGAYGDDDGGSGRGAVHIHFMNTDGSIDSTVEINDSTTNGPELEDTDWYGYSVVDIEDLDGDGVRDIAVGAVRDDEGGTDRGTVHIHFMYGEYIETTSSGTVDKTVTDKRPKRTGDRCYVEDPPALTWITLEPMTVDEVFGMQVRWTQYGANKMTIKIDDGSGNYPWRVDKTLNDGHEFLPNVQSWQNIKLKPLNHCNGGDYSAPVSHSSYPTGWYNE
jgi:hypothetical protein